MHMEPETSVPDILAYQVRVPETSVPDAPVPTQQTTLESSTPQLEADRITQTEPATTQLEADRIIETEPVTLQLEADRTTETEPVTLQLEADRTTETEPVTLQLEADRITETEPVTPPPRSQGVDIISSRHSPSTQLLHEAAEFQARQDPKPLKTRNGRDVGTLEEMPSIVESRRARSKSTDSANAVAGLQTYLKTKAYLSRPSLRRLAKLEADAGPARFSPATAELKKLSIKRVTRRQAVEDAKWEAELKAEKEEKERLRKIRQGEEDRRKEEGLRTAEASMGRQACSSHVRHPRWS